jgi:hypothetical protein
VALRSGVSYGPPGAACSICACACSCGARERRAAPTSRAPRAPQRYRLHLDHSARSHGSDRNRDRSDGLAQGNPPGEARGAHVALCGKCDAELAPGNRLIPAETDQANGLPHDPRKPAEGQGSSCGETTNNPSPDLTRRPLIPVTLRLTIRIKSARPRARRIVS